ncbi:hypothetical protein KFK09_025943 [Dendrobium nobile]|uniref:Uncharacterized protein n=1 Tax=Dendrobium nobile TaxID=94219 RepID=A0A8T3A6H5_DENNO|nr:hypothetical protein KFK09_025943 [Dendrobium nobile]
MGGSSLGGSYRIITTFLAPKEPTPDTLRETSKGKTVRGRPGDNFKKLTETELHEKRAKGLCFRCDEKYTPEHRYKDRTLKVLIDYDDEGMEEVLSFHLANKVDLWERSIVRSIHWTGPASQCNRGGTLPPHVQAAGSKKAIYEGFLRELEGKFECSDCLEISFLIVCIEYFIYLGLWHLEFG